MKLGTPIALVRSYNIQDGARSNGMFKNIFFSESHGKLAGGSNPGWARRALSVVLMFAGAAAGAWLLRYSTALPLAISGIASGLCALVSRVGAQI